MVEDTMEQLHRYEVLILTSPEITQDEIKDLETQFEKVVQAGKGSVISFERWGKYRLSYPVRKNDYGVYFLARFQLPVKDAGVMQNVNNLFSIKWEQVVMRTVTTALAPTGSIEYQRPRSLEEVPPKEEGYKERRSHHRSYEAAPALDEIGVESDEAFSA